MGKMRWESYTVDPTRCNTEAPILSRHRVDAHYTLYAQHSGSAETALSFGIIELRRSGAPDTQQEMVQECPQVWFRRTIPSVASTHQYNMERLWMESVRNITQNSL